MASTGWWDSSGSFLCTMWLIIQFCSVFTLSVLDNWNKNTNIKDKSLYLFFLLILSTYNMIRFNILVKIKNYFHMSMYRCLNCWICLVLCGALNNACLEMFGASHVVPVTTGTFITSWAVGQQRRQSRCPVLCCAVCAVGARQRRARACLRHLPSWAAVGARPPSRRVVALCRVTRG